MHGALNEKTECHPLFLMERMSVWKAFHFLEADGRSALVDNKRPEFSRAIHMRNELNWSIVLIFAPLHVLPFRFNILFDSICRNYAI